MSQCLTRSKTFLKLFKGSYPEIHSRTASVKPGDLLNNIKKYYMNVPLEGNILSSRYWFS